MPAISGEDRLVPPTTSQPRPPLVSVTRTASPVLGSATADTSEVVRVAHPGSLCQAGLATYWPHALPAPAQADSVHPRALSSATRLVPPTATTVGRPAG